MASGYQAPHQQTCNLSSHTTLRHPPHQKTYRETPFKIITPAQVFFYFKLKKNIITNNISTTQTGDRMFEILVRFGGSVNMIWSDMNVEYQTYCACITVLRWYDIV